MIADMLMDKHLFTQFFIGDPRQQNGFAMIIGFRQNLPKYDGIAARRAGGNVIPGIRQETRPAFVLQHRGPSRFRLIRIAGKMELLMPRPDKVIDLIRFALRICCIFRLIRHNDNGGAALGAVMTQIADVIGTA